MFSLKPTDAHAGLDKQIRALGTERLRSHGLAAERERSLPPDLVAELDKLGEQIHGAADLSDPLASVIALEALSFGDPGIAYAVLPSFQLSQLVRGAGTDQQREAFLPRAARLWSTASSVALYEGFGRGQTELMTVASGAGGGWSVTGRKIAVHHPGTADIAALVAQSVDGELIGFVSEGSPAGAEVESDSLRSGTLGGGVTPTGTVGLDGVTFTEAQRLASTGPQLHRAVGFARLMLAAVQVGAAAAAVDYAGTYASERQAFGKALTSYQGVTFVLVECETEVDSARLQLWETTQRLAETSDPNEIERLVGRAVRKANNTATQVTREGIQLLGVHGIVVEHPVERFWRHASTLSLVDFDPLHTTLSLV